jgi:hypothetical protein
MLAFHRVSLRRAGSLLELSLLVGYPTPSPPLVYKNQQLSRIWPVKYVR